MNGREPQREKKIQKETWVKERKKYTERQSGRERKIER